MGNEAAGNDKTIKILGFALIAALFVFCVTVEAQQPGKMARLGYLGTTSPTANPSRREALLQVLGDYGYVQGKNLAIDYRWTEGKAEILQEQAAQLVKRKPDVIFSLGPQATLAVKNISTTIPIVFVGIGDPVGIGIVASLAKPGGNITGIANQSPEFAGKRLELLKESWPNILSVAVFYNSMSVGNKGILKILEDVTPALKLKLYPLAVGSAEDFDGVFQTAAKSRLDALITLPDPVISTYMNRIVNYAVTNRLPAIFHNSESIDLGGLMSYAPSIVDQYRRAAVYIDKILKGIKPAELPIEQPKKFEFMVNLKTAERSGLTIPPNVLARADKVIK